MIRLIISGPPRTKKTSNRLVMAGGRPRVLPSAAWSTWTKSARITVDGLPVSWSGKLSIETGKGLLGAVPLNCAALFYRDARRGDAVGFYQGLADLLEKRGIIPNDACLVSWDGSRLLLDRQNPRVELTLTEAA